MHDLLGPPAVSKMERKADMSIGRFTEFVEALGGHWQIKVSFADGCECSAGHRAWPGRPPKELPRLHVIDLLATVSLGVTRIQGSEWSCYFHLDAIPTHAVRNRLLQLRGLLPEKDLDAGNAVALADSGSNDTRDRHPRLGVGLQNLLDRHGRDLAIRNWFTLTRALVRARWQDRQDEANEQAAGSGHSQAVSRDTAQGEIKVTVEQA